MNKFNPQDFKIIRHEDIIDEVFILGLDFYYAPMDHNVPASERLITKEQYLDARQFQQEIYKPCRTVMIARSVILARVGDKLNFQTVKSLELLSELAERLAPTEANMLDFIQGRISQIGDEKSPIMLKRLLYSIEELQRNS